MTSAERNDTAEAPGTVGGPVLIAGAGPVGMVLALGLARFGVRSVVVDAEAGASCEGSRSICVQNQTLEILDRLGCGDRIATEGVSWTVGRTYYGRTELFQTRLAAQGSAAFPPFVNLPQSRVEEILLAAMAASPLIEVRWEHRVTGAEQDAGGVRLAAEAPDGSRVELHGPYLVGCDGARSAVREALGLRFDGHSFDDRFLIADIRAELPFPSERRFFFDPPFNPGRQVLVHPQPDGVWRIDWQVPAGVDGEEERRSGRLDRRIREVVGEVPYELVWLSTYRFQQRLAERMAVGRAFLAGDAAHVMSPFGARGMNSGIADADNLAWKLALVLRGEAPAGLLDSYDAERRAAAAVNLAVTGATMRFMVPGDPLRRLARNAVLRGSLRLPWLRRFVNSGRLAEPFTYPTSPIVLPAPAAARRRQPGAITPLPGAVAPDAPCRLPGAWEPTRVRALLGTGLVGLWFAPTGTAAQPPPDAPTGRSARLYAVLPPGVDAEPAAGLPSLLDPDGAVARAYAASPGLLAVIRPDGHLAAILPNAGPGAFVAALDRACARVPDAERATSNDT
jgi:2-polyprenyl-6-methoxyphenol hydroxylase-like FAD-dependent oxidoreductase